eukprot:9260421-Ditylum_brightwellii.AAC.1
MRCCCDHRELINISELHYILRGRGGEDTPGLSMEMLLATALGPHHALKQVFTLAAAISRNRSLSSKILLVLRSAALP